ncbi:hypothetical protein ABMA28_013781 [Loxostege sticticalis]|uniref:Myrosinase 1-like n=1 Tax=Loxostege sticticalis TaxID=481309 RepID=A0ABD0TJL8_LOXSC
MLFFKNKFSVLCEFYVCKLEKIVTFTYIFGCNSIERKFPDGFAFGASTSAYQVEGAWNQDGKTDSIWDHLTHSEPSNFTGDVASNSYHLYKRDVEMMRELGLDFYRFSLSWSRILPTSFPDKINQAGVDYYNNLIDEMLKYNIQPMVTLHHFDLPQKLQELGGWTNPHVVDWFSDYARVVFTLFGDRVKLWITINEPHILCYIGHGLGMIAPKLEYSGVADYMCSKNTLLAHASAYHIYDKEFRPVQDGNIFISLSSDWYEPESSEHTNAAEDLMQFDLGQYAHPIFSKTGDWPHIMKEKIASKSAEQGFFRSRLPELSTQEVEFIRGTSDFFGINHYTTYYVYRNESFAHFPVPSFEGDLEVSLFQPKEWLKEGDGVAAVPWGFYKLLVKIKEDYGLPIFVTENGYCTNIVGPADDRRVAYHYGYLDALLDAIDDGVDVRAYSVWSLMDNFDWLQGFNLRHGLYEVDFENEQRPRTPRKSAFMYKQILRTRTLDTSFEPDSNAPMIID